MNPVAAMSKANAVKREIKDDSAAISELRGDVGNLKTSVNSLQESMETMQGNVDNLLSSILDVWTAINSLDERVRVLENK